TAIALLPTPESASQPGTSSAPHPAGGTYVITPPPRPGRRGGDSVAAASGSSSAASTPSPSGTPAAAVSGTPGPGTPTTADGVAAGRRADGSRMLEAEASPTPRRTPRPAWTRRPGRFPTPASRSTPSVHPTPGSATYAPP